jgi:type III secretory pathway component EscU
MSLGPSMMRKFDKRLRKIAQLKNCPFWMALMNVYPLVLQVNSFFAVSLVLGLHP